MKIEITETDRGLSFHLMPEVLDPEESRQSFRSLKGQTLERVGDRFEVELPPGFRVHTEPLAQALYRSLRPSLGASLTLSRPVSAAFAEVFEATYGVALHPVDPTARPFRSPEEGRAALLFSGGMDSAAASTILPADTLHVFLDRIPHFPKEGPQHNTEGLVDLERQREVCAIARREDREVEEVREDHEYLCRPYPRWHSPLEYLPIYYLMAERGITVVETGDVLGAAYLRGYHDDETIEQWGFTRRTMERQELFQLSGRISEVDRFLGLSPSSSTLGLSEVATERIVHASPFHDHTFSCYFPAEGFRCMRCDKCFKKVLLSQITDGAEVPATLLDHFLARPLLAGIFARPYFDWHHIWFYIFQKIRSSHWLVKELQAQARQGPDLSLLERWYPPARRFIHPRYRDSVERKISEYVDPMTDQEVGTLEAIDVPPLRVSNLERLGVLSA